MKQALEMIMERQRLIEKSGGDLNPLMICPSGIMSNGSAVLTFKQGPFRSETRIKPMYIKIDLNSTVSSSLEVSDPLPLLVIKFCWLGC